MRSRLRETAGVVAAMGVLTTGAVVAQQPSLRTVLDRAGAYVGEYHQQLGGVVVEERYLQDIVTSGDFSSAITVNIPGRDSLRGVPKQHRELTSELLLVHPVGSDRWVQFRDVFKVDGDAIRDRTDRLEKLFLAPSGSTKDQVRRIVDESARYNLGSLERTINVPLLPMLFLAPDVQLRFELTRVLDPFPGGASAPAVPGAAPGLVVPRNMPNTPAFAVPPDTWEVLFKETEAGTLIRTTGDRDIPAHGRFWIDPSNGRVVMSELELDDPVIHAEIDVAYRQEADLGFLVPAEMREQYVVRASNIHIYGIATYGKYRRFQVTVDEQLTPVK